LDSHKYCTRQGFRPRQNSETAETRPQEEAADLDMVSPESAAVRADISYLDCAVRGAEVRVFFARSR
jgi:hypothetical protein